MRDSAAPHSPGLSGPPIVLTTDFGLSDPYAGVMKGVIFGINPRAAVVDLTHQIQPQNILQAAFALGTSYGFFPSGTIHVAVVDPEVGTSRRALLLVTPQCRFLAPDNGILGYVLSDFLGPLGKPAPDRTQGQRVTIALPPGLEAYSLTNQEYFLEPVSNTFHGRDVFAPVAAHLSLGVTPEELGEPVREMVWLPAPEPVYRKNRIDGEVIIVDNFGNLVTNVPSTALSQAADVQVTIQGLEIVGLSQTFNQRAYQAGDSETAGPVALVGSNGRLEIAVPNGNAALVLGVGVGEPVNITLLRL